MTTACFFIFLTLFFIPSSVAFGDSNTTWNLARSGYADMHDPESHPYCGFIHVWNSETGQCKVWWSPSLVILLTMTGLIATIILIPTILSRYVTRSDRFAMNRKKIYFILGIFFVYLSGTIPANLGGISRSEPLQGLVIVLGWLVSALPILALGIVLLYRGRKHVW